MIVHQILVGGMQNFTYVIADEKTNKGIVVDPSWDIDRVTKVIRQNNIKIELIVNTHHHFDHTNGNEEMAKITGAPIAQHTESELDHDRDLHDGDTIEFGDSSLKVIHTPGHSTDGVCLLGDSKIIVGDTLFVGGCGRIDFPGGSARVLYKSLYDIICKLDDKITVYPGHDYGETPTTTIGQEKRSSPYLQAHSEDEFVTMLGG